MESSQTEAPYEFSVATIGFFDGVHRGHRFLINQVKALAKQQGMASAIVTFAQHPRQVLASDYQPQMLTTVEEKARLLKETGVDRCHILDFNAETAALSARDFMRDVLRDKLCVRHLVIGYDNRFGHNRAEGFDDYVRYGAELGINVVQAKAFLLNGVNVSSSVVRSFLSDGQVEMAAMCLGYRYSIVGTVVDGVKKGRAIGFPTANIKPETVHKMLPANGVYAVEARLDDGTLLPAMLNIGHRPTFGGHSTTIEVNILNYSGDLYGRQLGVTFFKRLRGEQRFSSERALMEQLEKDRWEVEELFKK